MEYGLRRGGYLRNWMALDGGSKLISERIFLATEKPTGANMDLKFSVVTRKGPITIVTLSRPEVYNALHTYAHFELNRVFDDFSADPEQWVAIVTGAGDKAVCAGNDLKWRAGGGGPGARWAGARRGPAPPAPPPPPRRGGGGGGGGGARPPPPPLPPGG